MICEHCQREIVKIARVKNPQLDAIVDAVAQESWKPKEYFMTKNRNQEQVQLRDLCFLLADELTNIREVEKVAYFRRDRHTIRHGIEAVQRDMKQDRFLKVVYDEAKSYLLVNNLLGE